jgi:hypothetical protein
LGAKRFKELQLMKFAWHQNVSDLAAWNSELIEKVDLDSYHDMLVADGFEDELNGVDSDLVVD